MSYMFSPAYWHQGLAMECATAVLDLAFDEMGHEEIIAETQKGNAASRRLLERLGMTPWKSLRRFGERQELYILRIADWRARTNVNT